MTDLAWLFIAFAAAWLGLGAYLFSISARQHKLERRLRELDGHSGDERP